MTLTLSQGPLAQTPAPGNYRIDGPEHRLFFDDFPRRMRAMYGGQTVLDSRRGKLVHETGMLPQLYVPEADVRADLLVPSEHTTHCPFKGDATYWSVRVEGHTADDAVWAYRAPHEDAAWLRGYVAVYWAAMDEWWDEDEPAIGHVRDPYHRVDVRRTSSRVRVLAGDYVVADTDKALLMSETGLPNRYYLPADAVDGDLLRPSQTTTVCPYKGTATYWSLRLPDRRLTDAVWSYVDPFEDAARIRRLLCLVHDELTLEVDGEPTQQPGAEDPP